MRSVLAHVGLAIGLVIATPASAEWREASTDHFLIYADSNEAWMQRFADRLERVAAALDVLQPNRDRSTSKSNRVVIYAVSGTNAVQKLCGRCGSVAGFYVPRVGHSVAYSARTTTSSAFDMSSDIVLFHEYTHHALLSVNGAALPRWYNEGFAEFASTSRVNDDGSVTLGLAAKHRGFNIINADMKIEQLLDSTAGSDSLSQDIFYGRAWTLVHLLVFDKARAGQLGKYLVALNDGTPNLQAARAAFGDLSKLQGDMAAYVRGRRLPIVTLPADRLKVKPATLRALTPGEAAMMPVRMRSDRGVGRQQALEIVADARKRAAAFADDPGAQMALAEAEYDAGNDVAAGAAADRALAVRPADIDALLYKGRVAVRQAAVARVRDPDVWGKARAWFVRANKVDPDAAEPLLLFYRSFAAAGQPPTKNAAAGLYYALELSPQDPGLRIAAARQYVIDDKVAEARRALLPLAFNPHIPAANNRFMRVIEAIDAGQGKAAILNAGVPGRKPDDDDADPEAP